jgi:serpin B
LHEVDFIRAAETVREIINTWVEKETRDKIKNLIPPGALSSLTRLVLTNAIYFKGNWARQFEKDKTIDAPFTLTNGRKVNVPMMNQTANFGYMEADNFQALELPYVDNELSMIILLPKRFDGLGDFEKKMNPEDLSNWLTKLCSRKVIVSVPRFKMTSQFGLAGVLKSMGMRDAFSTSADFSGMNGRKDLFISAVIHKAYVDVNEEGTEAAAPPVFRADRSFLFLIRDNHSGSILFIGRVMNPTLQS